MIAIGVIFKVSNAHVVPSAVGYFVHRPQANDRFALRFDSGVDGVAKLDKLATFLMCYKKVRTIGEGAAV